jgi:tetratricopeptide (TPR) repeat protein
LLVSRLTPCYDPGVSGRTISHYRILAPLGRGGMGEVYEAEDTRLGRHVALKLLPAEACCVPEALERFLREARIVSSLNHPHICTLHDIGDDAGQHFMVMELLDGESLKDRIARGPLPLDQLLDLGVQIADALDAAHGAGVIHRDIKPANLFITRRGQAKVLDFGVAKLAEGPADAPGDDRTRAASELTTAGSAIGTVAYMSPEQARGHDLDARSDLFSFGDVLYEMATGRPAFAGPTHAVIFEGILTKHPTPPSALNANVPAELDRVIAKALEKDRETRYQSASEVRADLKRLKRDTESGRTLAVTGVTAATPSMPAPAPPAGPAAATSRRAMLVGAPLLTAAVIGGVLLWQSQRTPALRERDLVVLADFRNRTGDAMFDDTLSEALSVQLRQSPYLNLLPEQQVQATLQLMGRDGSLALTAEIAREVCQRAGAKAMLAGTIAPLGTSYVVTLSAEDCVSGQVLAEEQVQASAKEEVIAALGGAASSFRETLGESLASIQRYDSQIEQATTQSLEALKAYSQGMAMRRTKGDFEALPLFRRAVEIDPDFALAHGRLGTVLSNLGERDEAEKAATRAYELRDKVSERERLYIEARYHTTVARDQEKAIESYRALLATYPDDFAGQSNLGSIYRDRGRMREAITHLEESVRLAPGQPLGFVNLGYAYLAEGRFEEARRSFETVLTLQDSTTARNGLLTIGVITGDEALADAQIVAVKGRRDEAEQIGVRVQAAAFRGRMREAATLTDELFRRAQAANRLAFAAEGFIGFAIAHATVGRTEDARRQYDRVSKAVVLEDSARDAVVALAGVLGDRALAEANVEAALRHVRAAAPVGEADQHADAVRALAALAGGRYEDAYRLSSRPFTQPSPAQRNTQFVAGYAALQLRRWDDATRAFEALVAERSKIGLSSIVPTTYIMLARAHGGAGRAADARRAYDEAFRIWANADPDLPLLIEARKEHAALP